MSAQMFFLEIILSLYEIKAQFWFVIIYLLNADWAHREVVFIFVNLQSESLPSEAVNSSATINRINLRFLRIFIRLRTLHLLPFFLTTICYDFKPSIANI